MTDKRVKLKNDILEYINAYKHYAKDKTTTRPKELTKYKQDMVALTTKLFSKLPVDITCMVESYENSSDRLLFRHDSQFLGIDIYSNILLMIIFESLGDRLSTIQQYSKASYITSTGCFIQNNKGLFANLPIMTIGINISTVRYDNEDFFNSDERYFFNILDLGIVKNLSNYSDHLYWNDCTLKELSHIYDDYNDFRYSTFLPLQNYFDINENIDLDNIIKIVNKIIFNRALNSKDKNCDYTNFIDSRLIEALDIELVDNNVFKANGTTGISNVELY